MQNATPKSSLYRTLLRLYPYELIIDKSKDENSGKLVEVTAVDEILKKSGFQIEKAEVDTEIAESTKNSSSQVCSS